MSGGAWLLCRTRREGAERLYCFPHSGGSAGEFLAWSDLLPDREIWGVQAPGRGGRIGEEPLTTMRAMVTAIVDEVDFVAPYDLFGHSLGATVAYEVAVALRAAGQMLPRCLYLSGHPAPRHHVPDPSFASLTDDDLIDHVEDQFGAVPAELRDDPDWRALALAPLRADLRIVAGYRPSDTDPLPCAVVALGGTDDTVVTEPGLAAWRDHTTGPFELRMFTGDHFYFRENQDDVLDYLSAHHSRLARRALPGSPALG